MCDIWKANANKQELTRDDLLPHVKSFKNLHVQRFVLSGGEALMHSNLWLLCELLKELNAQITLLSTGLLLKTHAANIVRWCDEVIVSVDGAGEVHNAVRRIPRAFERLAEGVAALRDLQPGYPVSGRSVLQRTNFRDLPQHHRRRARHRPRPHLVHGRRRVVDRLQSTRPVGRAARRRSTR